MCNENNLTYNRFGFVVSLVVSKKAVIRNKIRRRLYAIVQHIFPTLLSGYDCVVWAYPEATELGYQEIEGHMRQMFERIRMLKL
ncbi:MAG: hypothetical protein G01um101429_162 [Parcubacteria group bacterium Gr01-1014_29]|nr:MAG: hypothetical protein G01um101429_162 [Parcubacteria group bacterium Gr01-1014_29]